MILLGTLNYEKENYRRIEKTVRSNQRYGMVSSRRRNTRVVRRRINYKEII